MKFMIFIILFAFGLWFWILPILKKNVGFSFLGSQNIIPVKVNQSSDDESDKEELAGSENVQVFESKEKPVKESSISCHVNKSGSESTSGIKEEDDSDDSDFSACVLVGDTPVEFLPNLDFNLAGGVSKLLSGENSKYFYD